jgi:hypothetical protein
MVGDTMYMPPEADDMKYDTKFDVWRFGLLAFEVICGVTWYAAMLV